jgi:ABC-type nitrate/sulfonate/bicarbonate transport system substrate-binding protein
MYVAQSRGYYKSAGLDVKFLPGGPSVVPETIVLAGKAQVGLSSADAIASAILKGAPFKIIATQYQDNPFGIMSLAKDPVTSAKELIGRSVGVSDENKPELDAFLTLNGIDSSKIKMVPIGSSDISTYLSGQISASLDFFDTPLTFAAKGIKTHFVSLTTLGYSIISDSYFTTEDMIKNEPDKLEALLTGDVRGWAAQVSDPTMGATLGVKVYGKGNGLILSNEVAAAKLQNDLISTAATKKLGLLTIGSALQTENIKSLSAAGIKISAAQLFDDRIINAVYAKKPSLRGLV